MQHKMLSQSIGDNIRDARESRNLTQNDLSRMSGINVSQIAHYESGSREPSLNNAKIISLVLDVSLDRLSGIRCENQYDHGFRDGLRHGIKSIDKELKRLFIISVSPEDIDSGKEES